MNKTDLETRIASLVDQDMRSQYALDKYSRRNGELRVMLGDLIEAVESGDYASVLADAKALCEEKIPANRYCIVSDLTNAAIDLVNGNEDALDTVKAKATEIRDYTKVVIENGKQTGSPVAVRSPRQAKVVCTEDEAIDAMQMVAAKVGSIVSIKAFNENHPTMNHTDVIAVFGKWSAAQAAAGLEVTKRGRRPVAV